MDIKGKVRGRDRVRIKVRVRVRGGIIVEDSLRYATYSKLDIKNKIMQET